MEDVPEAFLLLPAHQVLSLLTQAAPHLNWLITIVLEQGPRGSSDSRIRSIVRQRLAQQGSDVHCEAADFTTRTKSGCSYPQPLSVTGFLISSTWYT